MGISRDALIKALQSAETKKDAVVTNARRGRVVTRNARRRVVRNEDEDIDELDDLAEGDIDEGTDDDITIGDDVIIELDPEETVEVTGTVVGLADDEDDADDEPEYEEVSTENVRRRFRKIKNARLVRNGRGGYTVLAPVTKKYRKVTKNSRWNRVRNEEGGIQDKSTGDADTGYKPEGDYAEVVKVPKDAIDWNGYTENLRRQRIVNARKAKAYDAIVARARRIRNEDNLRNIIEDVVAEKLTKNSRSMKPALQGRKYFKIKNYRVINADGDDITAETFEGGQQPQPGDEQVIQLELRLPGDADVQPNEVQVDVAGEGVPQDNTQPSADPGMNDQGQAPVYPVDERVQNCGRIRNARRRIRNARRRYSAIHNEDTVVNNASSVDVAPLDVPSTFPESK